jgi:stage II sporulation protein D
VLGRDGTHTHSTGGQTTMSVFGGNVSIVGRGWGHGVGMSQFGARGMAEAGYTYVQILKHYYTGIEVR